MNKDFLKIINQLNQAEKLTSLAVIEQVKKLTKLNEENKKELETLINAYEVLKSYYEGMPLEKEITKIGKELKDLLDTASKQNKSELKEDTKKLEKALKADIKDIKGQIETLFETMPESSIERIIERVEEKRNEEKPEEIAEKLNTLNGAIDAKVIKGLEDNIDASKIKSLKSLLPKNPPMYAGGSGASFLKSLRDVNLTGLEKDSEGKYILGSGSGSGGGGEMFIDQTPDNGTYSLLTGDIDGVNTTFTVSEGEYPTGKLVVALNGQILEQGATEDFVETDPGSGTFDFVSAPVPSDVITVFYSTGTGGGGGASAFIDLTDVPSSYSSQALKVVRVNAGETGLEFVTLSGGGDMLASTYDPANKAEQVLTIGDILDEDDMSSDSATKVPSQQSVKAYVDANSGGTVDGSGTSNQFTYWSDSDTIASSAELVRDGSNIIVQTTPLQIKNTSSVIHNISHNNVSYFGNGSGGQLRIGFGGVTSPTAKIHVGAGTTAASTAPLKLTAGTNMTTPEAGAIEFDGTDLFYTDSGATRQTIANMGDIPTPLALETDGTPNGDQTLLNLKAGTNITLSDNGVGSVTITAAGNVSKVGTPANNQIGVWTGDGTIEGDVDLTWDTSTNTLGVGLTALDARVQVHAVKSDASDGLLIEASNGTDIGLLGAGNTANVTWYGSHNFDVVTASRVAQFGSSKILESSSVTTTELGYVSGVTSAIQTQLDAKANLLFTINAQTGTSYDLLASDSGKLITMDNASANTVDVPLNATTSIPVGFTCIIQQIGAGQTSINPEGGVTINSILSWKDIVARYGAVQLVKTATNTWSLWGDIS